MLTLTPEQQRAVSSVLEEIRRAPRYRGGVVLDDNGESHPWGAATSGADRMGQALGTKRDVSSLRSALKEAGLPLTFGEVDNLLSEALWADDGKGGWYVPGEIHARKRRRHIRKRTKQIERRKRAGKCIVCGQECAPRVTCITCGYAANARQRAARARKKQAA